MFIYLYLFKITCLQPAVAHPAPVMPGTGMPPAAQGRSTAVTPEQMSKLRADIDIVQGDDFTCSN